MIEIPAVVKRGYGVASGSGADSRFPNGTLSLQIPLLRERGLDLRGIYPGTINLDIAPLHFAVAAPEYHFADLVWSGSGPAETFSFCRCVVVHAGTSHRGLIYYPHPESKPEHFHSDSTVEILAPWIEGLDYGDAVTLSIEDRVLRLWR